MSRSDFARFHRGNQMVGLGRVLGIDRTCLLIVSGMWRVGTNALALAPSAASSTPLVETVIVAVADPSDSATEVPVALSESLDQPPVTVAPTGPLTSTIANDATGGQAEIDECLGEWTPAPSPLVGAHNYCDGDIVLDMQVGDTVVLSGAELNAAYLVARDRAAHSGDKATLATDGMIADVILQTCYRNIGGQERLVALQSTDPIVVS